MAAVVNTAPPSLERIQSALNFVCPDDRETWLRVGMAIKSETAEEGEWLWHDWSKGASTYHEADAKAVWRSIKAGGKVGIGSLFHLAKENGWTWTRPERRLSAADIAAMREASRLKAEAAAAEKAAEQAKAGELAAAIWNGTEPATAHPYLTRKGIAAQGLRVGAWDVVNQETGEVRRVSSNALLVPIKDRIGRIHSLQAILPNGSKLYLAGGAKAGNFYAIGKPQDLKGRKVFILAEGLATAASIHEASGHAALVCFDAGNLLPVAAAIRERQPDAIILLAADDDRFTTRKDGTPYNPGVDAATKAAQEVGGLLAVPRFASLDGEPTDWNDLACREGADAVKAQIAAALAGTPIQAEPEPTDELAGVADVLEADAGAGASKNGRRAASWDAVAEINQQHSLALMGDKVVVLRETIGESGGKELLFMSVGAFKTWYMNKFVPVETTNNDGAKTTKNTPVADVWLKSDRRRQYEGVTFSPSNNAPANHYNLWSGYAVEPLDCGLFCAAMKCRRLLAHMKSNLCGGNREHFRYLLAWAADMLQDPDRKKGVALIMRGMKGTGKSTFADALKALLGRHAIKVAHMRHLTGNFNRHLADKLLVVAEESFWAGDKADEGPLKDMITSPTLTVEAKGIDAVEMRSLCRVMMITNSDWAVPASTDERRYFVLDVSDRRRQDFKYFAAIEEQLVNGGLSALLTVLLRLPLDKANLRKVPETLALRKQRALSLEPHDQFVFDALADGTLLGGEWRSDLPVGKDDLYDAYVDSSRKRGKTHLLTKATFGQKFMHATGASPTRLWNNGARLQAYKLLSRSDAAEIFTNRFGVDVDLLDTRG